MQDYQDRVAFITGGAGEEGLAIACALGEAGARIALVDEAGERLEKTRILLRDKGIEILAVAADVADRAEMRRAAETAVSHFGKVHLLIASAQQRSRTRLADMSKAEWDRAFAVNVGGLINLLHELLPVVLRQQEGGHLLARVPISGVIGGAADGARAAHASAVVMLMESLFGELRRQSVGSSLLITSDRFDEEDAGGGDSGAKMRELGARAARGMAQGDVYIFADSVPPAAIQNYFTRLLASMPKISGAGGSLPGDPAEIFPTYAAVLRAKGSARAHV